MLYAVSIELCVFSFVTSISSVTKTGHAFLPTKRSHKLAVDHWGVLVHDSLVYLKTHFPFPPNTLTYLPTEANITKGEKRQLIITKLKANVNFWIREKHKHLL